MPPGRPTVTQVPTEDGNLFYSFLDHVGTMDVAEAVEKILYDAASLNQWHENGVERFVSVAGVALIAVTQRDYADVFVIKDPWVYSNAYGGADVILQRFGTPVATDGTFLNLGLAAGPHKGD